MGGFILPAAAGLSALAGIFGGSKSTSQSTTTTNPNFTPQEQALINLLNGQYTGLINNAPAWNKAYETTGTQNIANSANNAVQAANDALAQRGISRTTSGAQSVANTGYQEGQNLSNFLNQAPIVEQNQLSTNLGNAASFEASLPIGTTGTSNTTGTGNQPINPLAGFITGGSQGLAAALGQQSATTSLGNILKNLGLNQNIPAANTGISTIPKATTSNGSNGSTLSSMYPTDNFTNTGSDGEYGFD